MTKDQLLIQNGELQNTADLMKAKDESLRKTFSDLLGQYSYENRYGSSNQDKKIEVCSWNKIAFLIGELTADANYSCCIDAREELKREVQDLKDEIYRLNHPEKS